MPISQGWGMTEISPVGLHVLAARRVHRRRRRHAGRDPGDRRHARCPASRRGSSTRTRRRNCPGTTERPGELEVRRSVGRAAVLPSDAPGEQFSAGRLAAHRRRRRDLTARLHPPRRPHQGPDQVRRRVDQLGRSGEPDHGASRRWPRPRSSRSRTRSGWSGRWPWSCSSPDTEVTSAELMDYLRERGPEPVGAARRHRLHRRAAEDQRGQVLQAGPAGQVQRLPAGQHLSRTRP